MGLETEIFLVVTNRKDGRLPDPVKSVGHGCSEIFFTIIDAEEFLKKIVAENGRHYGIYRASLRIEARAD